jgi:NAD(P)-dependent dehydrogenase (short-subunit alcohol dehydrogenase family)
MHQVEFDPSNLHALTSRTVIITGGAGGIGAAAAKVFNEHGANVVIADIPVFEEKANQIIASLPHPSQALFVPVDILNWEQMTTLFKRTIQVFGALHVVVANAGTMESAEVLNLDDVDGDGNLRESHEAFKVIDVNLKGTLNSMSRHIQLEHDNNTNHALILCSFATWYESHEKVFF